MSDSEDSLDAAPPPRYTVEDRQDLITDLNAPWILSAEGLAQKERELRIREENLGRKERTLGDREKVLKAKISGPNWPPCCPLVYHHIEDQIPEERQKTVRMAYYGFFAVCVAHIGNIVGLFLAAILPRAPEETEDAAPSAPPAPPAPPAEPEGGNLEIGSSFLALFLAFVLIPFTFANFRILYAGARKDKPSLYLLFIVISIMFQFLASLYFALGWRGYGGMGLVVGIAGSLQTFALVYAFVMMGIWIALAVYSMVVVLFVRKLYHGAGGLAKAKQEAAEAGAREAAKHPDAAITVAGAVA